MSKPIGNQKHRVYGWLRLFVMIPIICIATWGIAGLIAIFVHPRYERVSLLHYAIDIPAVWGSDWYIDDIREPSVMENPGGFRGIRAPSLIGSLDVYTRHVKNSEQSILYSIFMYANPRDVLESYNIQNESTFYVHPRQRDLYLWRDINLITNLGTDAHRVACQENIADDFLLGERCTAILLYGRCTVYLNMRKTQDGEEYISTEQMEALFAEVDVLINTPGGALEEGVPRCIVVD